MRRDDVTATLTEALALIFSALALLVSCATTLLILWKW